jgi:hypothetical protein
MTPPLNLMPLHRRPLADLHKPKGHGRAVGGALWREVAPTSAWAKSRWAMTNLNAKAWLSLAVLAVAMGLLLFIPAGTVHYWQAGVYLSIFTSTSILTTCYLMRHDRALLERRMRGGPMAEKRPVQKLIMLCTSIGFIALLVVPALDFRYGWSAVPPEGGQLWD